MPRKKKNGASGLPRHVSESDCLRYRLNVETLRRMEAELAAQRIIVEQSRSAIVDGYRLGEADSFDLMTGEIIRIAPDAAPR